MVRSDNQGIDQDPIRSFMSTPTKPKSRCPYCAAWFHPINRYNKFCTTKHGIKWAKQKPRAYKERVEIRRQWKRICSKIIAADGFKCQYCGKIPADGARLVIDHIIPIHAGGKTSIYNLITACERCNSKKGSKILPRNLQVRYQSYCRRRKIVRRGETGLLKRWGELFTYYHEDRVRILKWVS